MPTLYLHFGMPKTGTTTLQHFLHHNRELLYEHGLYYAETKNSPYHKFLFEKTYGQRKDFLRSVYSKSAPGNHDAVISYEAAIYLLGDDADDLLVFIKNLFKNYSIRIVIYISRIDRYWKGSYNQATKNLLKDWVCSYQEFLSYAREHNYENPLPTVQKSEALVGRENILLRIYDRNLLVNNDIIDDFFDCIGHCIPAGAVRLGDKNISPPPQHLPYLSSSILPFDSTSQKLRNRIAASWRNSFTFPKGTGAGAEHHDELLAEIEALDGYLPGYKNLFADRPLDMSFPEVDVQNHESLYLASLLYLALSKLDRLERIICQHDNRFRHEGLAKEAQRLCGEELLFFGAGAAYEYYKDCFAAAKPVAMLLDEEFAASVETIDGIKVKIPAQLTDKEKKLPLVLFCRGEHREKIMLRIAEDFPDLYARQRQGHADTAPGLIECILEG